MYIRSAHSGTDTFWTSTISIAEVTFNWARSDFVDPTPHKYCIDDSLRLVEYEFNYCILTVRLGLLSDYMKPFRRSDEIRKIIPLIAQVWEFLKLRPPSSYLTFSFYLTTRYQFGICTTVVNWASLSHPLVFLVNLYLTGVEASNLNTRLDPERALFNRND